MTEKIVFKKNWEYTLVKDSGKYVLKVLCGGAGMFEVNYQLTEYEVNTAKKDEVFCSTLADKIRQAPSKYSGV